MKKMKKIPQDIIGDIAILKFPKGTWKITKKLRAMKFLKTTPNITTVLEKTGKFKGRLRTHKTKHLAGLKTKEANYKENGCTFHFNIDETYFSPRLSNERKVIAEQVAKLIPHNKNFLLTKNKTFSSQKPGARGGSKSKKDLRGGTLKKTQKILVMFAGVAPYPITIAKTLKQQNKHAQIYSNELNRKANKYAEKNIYVNKLQNMITLIPGDAKKLSDKKVMRNSFDVILMPRPNLKDTFLKTTLKLSKRGTVIFYHGFGTKEEVLSEIKKDCGKKIGKISIRKAGDIGPSIYRWQAVFKVL